MKNLKVFAFVFAFVIATSSLFAIGTDIPAKEIRNQVSDLFENPDMNINEDTVVNITFTFNTEGEIVVLNIDSKDKEVIKYVSRKHES